jgi:hypothetical protein
LRLPVPKSVAFQAARRSAGDGAAPPPILMLEGLEVAAHETLEITVLGPPRGAGRGEVLAVTGMVGSLRPTPAPGVQKVTMPVPLNDAAARLLADRSEVTLTLSVAGEPNRPPLKYDRAFFVEP